MANRLTWYYTVQTIETDKTRCL